MFSKMSSRSYSTRSNTFIGNSTAAEASELISNLQSTLLSRFDDLIKELLDLKHLIIKNLQTGNGSHRKKSLTLAKE